ncbi:hypothetical protein Val02_74390 [Virgisporangium aliadipatigenens]|uniref:HTH cro/C1-type domain-containing protein n=1 Tax=Virgisporangium aliadipatigenens TaxID=741659 RepID=A0A8J3YU72_9ACTN|nr:helix-turn-helix domain-containing protein [Virgisporangium aliadipatigenens]GIJ50553.1 hypothetical protein Val02_74390 [Virgisporangium aliadipatigenens]
MTEANPLGILLRRHRGDAGLTIDELAAAARVSVRAISDLERGRSRVPQQRTVDALIRAMGLPGPAADAVRAAARAGRRPPPPVPGLAPPRVVADFTGRESELRRFAELVGDRDDGAVVVVSGPPGVGKTSLVVQAAARLAEHFPDGVFFLDLRGLDDVAPGAPELVSRLLIALGVDEARVPADPADRSALYRAVVAGRRVLLLLDNAADEAQVRPLLPGSGRSTTVVTSRRGLAGLEAVERLALPVLSRGEAVQLLRRIIGARADTQPESGLHGLAEVCGHLPLALRIAGNRLLSRPDWSIGYLLRRLGDADRRLDLLSAGDLQVAAPFTQSYRRLSAAAARMFRRLALVPGADAGVELAASVAGVPLRAAEAALEELVESGLLQSAADGRYRFHDLLRLFARSRLQEEHPGERHAAENRMVTWLLDTTIAAGRRFDPDRAAPDEPPSTMDDAAHWLEHESLNWLGALRSAFRAERHAEVMAVADAVHWYSERWRHWEHWLEVFRTSAASARIIGGAREQAVHLNYLAWAYTTCALRHDLAAEPASQALHLAREAGDLSEQGWSFVCIGAAARRRGAAEQAGQAAAEALPLFEAAADRDGYSQALALLAASLAEAGRHREAIAQYRRLEALLSEPDRAPSPLLRDVTAGHLHLNLGMSLFALRRLAPATERLRHALPLLQRSAMRQSEARCRYGLGSVLARQGQVEEARTELRRAVRIARQAGQAPLADLAMARLSELGLATGRRPR